MTTENIALRMHRISPDEIRRCLKCSRVFPSTGKGNRICPRCKGRNAKTRVYDSTSAKPICRTVV